MKTYRNDLSADFVRSVLDYDTETGVFRWKWRADKKQWWNASHPGSVAGTLCKISGYVTIKINGKNYFAHRLAWLIVHDLWPPAEVDHKNLCRSDNSIKNLRPATCAENKMNAPILPNNVAKLKGVSFYARIQKWKARIRVENHYVHLGVFNCPAAAYFAYQIAADKHFGEFARFA